MAYRIYVTDSLYYGTKGMQFERRYAEFIGLVQVDTRTGDEIALDVIKNAGLEVT